MRIDRLNDGAAAPCSVTSNWIVPATVPVCSPSDEAGCIAFAGIVNGADLPPVENWMAGSSAAIAAFGVKRKLTVPEIGSGYALAKVRFNGNCCAASATSGTDVKLIAGA